MALQFFVVFRLTFLDRRARLGLTKESELPYAVVASKEKVHAGDTVSRVRQYPWGIVEGEAAAMLLRPFLVSCFARGRAAVRTQSARKPFQRPVRALDPYQSTMRATRTF